ncbi:hypothetical protein ACWCP6_34985 [Streptomyces sp. NPDC002004]
MERNARLMTPHRSIARAQTSTIRLRALREAGRANVMRRLAAAATPVRVGRYALVETGRDASARLSQTQEVIVREGWTPVLATWDDTGMTDPTTRPQLARLYAAIRRGELHGIVAASRSDISTFHSIYEDTLTDLRALGAFLALARDETTL